MNEQPKCQHRFPSRPLTKEDIERMRSEGQHHRRCDICEFMIWDQYWHGYKKEGPPPPRYDYDELMEELKSFEEIIEEDGGWCALLKNHREPADSFYDQSHGDLSIRVQASATKGEHTAMLSVHSIDDGSIVLIGPSETEEKAQRRVLLLKAKAESWGGWIPTVEQVGLAAVDTGCYWNR